MTDYTKRAERRFERFIVAVIICVILSLVVGAAGLKGWIQ